jgi:hypothetical protein
MASIEKSACLGAGASTKQHAMLRRAPAAPDAAVGPQTSLGWRRRALNTAGRRPPELATRNFTAYVLVASPFDGSPAEGTRYCWRKRDRD